MLIEVDALTGEVGQHVVSFYDHDEALALTVGSFLGAGLAAGEAAIVVATPAHRELFDAALEAAGIDLAFARAAGQYVSLDAAELLAAFLVAGQPDPALFDATVGALVRQSATGRPVRVFGEMVALLWDDGAVTAAMALEQLWNATTRVAPFALLCAYPQRALGDSSARREAICMHHNAVVATVQPPTPRRDRAARRFEPTASSAAAARRFVTDQLHGWQLGGLVDAAGLIVSELVGNAVRHSTGRFHVGVLNLPDGVRVTVADLSPQPPTVRTVEETATSGRGMHLIAALARSWGTDVHGGGKTVWAEIAVPELARLTTSARAVDPAQP
ncbi:MAG: putative two-component sensor histidine kinase protein [Frankiales bacterium]|nr:putative two-component sensor histidine kinase protein [Frankiales bacterium]